MHSDIKSILSRKKTYRHFLHDHQTHPTHLTINGIAKVLLGHPDARRGEEDEDGDAVVHPANNAHKSYSLIHPISYVNSVSVIGMPVNCSLGLGKCHFLFSCDTAWAVCPGGRQS